MVSTPLGPRVRDSRVSRTDIIRDVKLSDGIEWGVHACVVLSVLPPDAAMPAAKIAEYHGVPAAYLAKHLQALAGAGLLVTVKGPHGGYRLARPATEITVLDVVEAIDGPEPAFRCTEIRRRGPVSLPAREYASPCGIHRAFMAADDAWRDQLRSTTVADLAIGVLHDVPPAALEKGLRWIQDAMR
jgi:Rrf2 family protein